MQSAPARISPESSSKALPEPFPEGPKSEKVSPTTTTGEKPGEGLKALWERIKRTSVATEPDLTPKVAAAPVDQAALLQVLAANERVAFDGVHPSKKAELLEGLRLGEVEMIRRELGGIARLAARSAPAADAPPEVLIAELVTAQGASLLAKCTSSILDTLNDRGELSFKTIHGWCEEIVRGKRDPVSLIDPLRKTRAAIRAGKEIKNPGAYFSRGVQNYAVERGSS
jgi:hypothetical protein